MDVFLLILVVVIIAIAVGVSVRVLLYYQQEDDAKFASSVLCKTVIVISLTLAWFMILLLPIDVRNSRPVQGIIDMQAMWTGTFITLAVFLVVVVPGAMFWHEIEDDSDVKKKKCYVACRLLVMIVLAGCAVAISHAFLSEAAIPVTEYTCEKWQSADAHDDVTQLSRVACAEGQKSHVRIKVGFHVYLIAVMCFIGWFLLVMFGGIGLSAVPLDAILEFKDRPRAISEKDYQKRRKLLGTAAQALLQRSEELRSLDAELASQKGWRARRKKRSLQALYNRFKCGVHLLEDEHGKLKVSKFEHGENLVIAVAKLVMGIVSAILSITWILHVILVVLVPQLDPNFSASMLDAILMATENPGAYPLGVALFSVYTLYLLLCVVKGCLKFGLRIFFLLSLHPMRPKATPLNSILFNVELLLISSAAVVQFSQTAFANYARLTDADVIFSAQIRHLTFYRWFFEHSIFIWALLIWFLLSLIFLLVRPREGGKSFRLNTSIEKELAEILGPTKIGKPADSSTPQPESLA